MGFLWPVYLLSLAFVPVIIVYHVFRPKSTRVVVPSVVLWQKALTSSGRHSAWDRLVKNLLLIVQILVIVACTLAMSGFFMNRLVTRPEHYVIVIDTSASMASTDADPDRLSVAKAAAISYLRSLPENSLVALCEFNSTANLRVDYTRDRRSVEKVISELKVRNTSTDADSLLSLLAALAEGSSYGISIALFTDGGFAVQSNWLDESASKRLSVDVYTVGGQSKNVAITDFEIRRPPHGEGLPEVLATVENFSSERFVFPLNLFYGDTPVRSEFIELGPFERKVISHQLQAAPFVPIRLEIAPADHLALDNVAYTVAREPGSRSVLLVTRDNRNLYMALRSIPGLRVYTRAPGETVGASPYGYDLVLYDETPAGSVPATNTVVINSPGGFEDVSVLHEYEYATAIYVDRTHPVMRYVDERAIVAETGQVLTVSSDVEIAAYGRFGPLIVFGRSGQYKYAYFGFPFTSKSFLNSASFPILVYNLVSYMLESSDAVRQLRPGDSIYVPVESRQGPGSSTGSGVSAKITRPTGDTQEFEVAGDFLLYTDTYETGIYHVTVSNRQYSYSVNLFDPQESDILRRSGADSMDSRILKRSSSVTDASSSVSVFGEELHLLQRVDLRVPLISTALFLLVLEWSLYHKRWHL